MRNKLTGFQIAVIVFSIIAAVLSISFLTVEYFRRPVILSLPGVLLPILGAILGGFTSFALSQLWGRKSIAKVFISYSENDADFVHQISQDLERNNVQVITNENALLVGDNIKEKISEAISNSDFFIVVISERAAKSSWIQHEIKLADEYHKKIFPIIKDNVEVPVELSSLKYADFRSDYQSALALLLKSLLLSSHLSNNESKKSA